MQWSCVCALIVCSVLLFGRALGMMEGPATQVPSVPAVPGVSASAKVMHKSFTPCIAATWDFGALAVETARAVLQEGGTALDAVERGINRVELDVADQYYVGYGGLPNAKGVMEMDAALMDHHRCVLLCYMSYVVCLLLSISYAICHTQLLSLILCHIILLFSYSMSYVICSYVICS
jgi:hypothetical protein